MGISPTLPFQLVRDTFGQLPVNYRIIPSNYKTFTNSEALNTETRTIQTRSITINVTF